MLQDYDTHAREGLNRKETQRALWCHRDFEQAHMVLDNYSEDGVNRAYEAGCYKYPAAAAPQDFSTTSTSNSQLEGVAQSEAVVNRRDSIDVDHLQA